MSEKRSGEDHGNVSNSAKKKAKSRRVEEKRMVRYRSAPPAGIRDRIGRALSQRMFLIERTSASSSGCEIERGYKVLGSTGNVYEVTISKISTCTCPDHQRSSTLCKHIIFVFCRALHVPTYSRLLYQAALLSSEVAEMFASEDGRAAQQAFKAPQEVIDALHHDEPSSSTMATTSTRLCEGECPICFENMSPEREACKSCNTCKNFGHAVCIEKWLRNAPAKTCPLCRGVFEAAKNGASLGTEGYVNLGTYAGLSSRRVLSYRS